MPTRTIWVNPDVLIEHRGVRVFYTYRDDDYDQGANHYWFTLNPECGLAGGACEERPCPHVFDVRELPTWHPPPKPPSYTGANDTPENHAAWKTYWELEQKAIMSAIKAAIENGTLAATGCRD